MFKGFSKRNTAIDLAAPAALGPGDRSVTGKENARPHSMFLPRTVQKSHQFLQNTNGQQDDIVTNAGPRYSQQKLKTDPASSDDMAHAFDKLLDDLQIPDSLRPKLDGMDSTVKAQMLRSSQFINPLSVSHATNDSHNTTPRKAPKSLRKTKSSDSVTSPRASLQQNVPECYDFPQPPRTTGRFLGAAMRSSISLGRSSDDEFTNSSRANGSVAASKQHIRGMSYDPSKTHLPQVSSKGDGGKKSQKGWAKDMAPSKYTNILMGTSSLDLDIEIVKKLRLLLRNESANWTETFLKLHGYSALLIRLNELLEVEWREEQHDDQLLHEILRCFKALSTSAVGCAALRSASPAPFAQLIRLIYSDKKPGDVATRQLITELLLILFDLYPPSSLPAQPGSRSRRQEAWEDAAGGSELNFTESSRLIYLPSPHRNLYTFIRSLLLTKAPPPVEAPETPLTPHEFIESLHVPRIYKTYLQELSDVCRDYFWIFCHPSNTIWLLEDTDEKRVEKPRAPGGMTGGVEFEAMSYLCTHFKFINAIAKSAADLNLPSENEFSAYRFHADLFASGIERIIAVARKASTTYYPTLHLEIARYIASATAAQYEIPWTLSRLIGAPPSSMIKGASSSTRERERGRNTGSLTPTHTTRGVPVTPTRDRASGPHVPKIPTPKKVEPLRF